MGARGRASARSGSRVRARNGPLSAVGLKGGMGRGAGEQVLSAAVILVTDGMRRADAASLEGLLQGWGGRKVVVRGRRWRGFGALPLARVCDGVVAGFEDVGLLVPVVVRWLRGQVVPSARQA